jgi:hypothetical protein
VDGNSLNALIYVSTLFATVVMVRLPSSTLVQTQLEYHPSSFDPETGRQLKQLAVTIWNIPSNRLMDSTFWTSCSECRLIL